MRYDGRMGVLKSLVDKAQAKKRELEKRAAEKAAEEAAALALARGKKAAREVIEQAGKSIKEAGASIEQALFGRDREGPEAPANERPKPARVEPRPADTAAAREAEQRRIDREVDDELAAMKRRLQKP